MLATTMTGISSSVAVKMAVPLMLSTTGAVGDTGGGGVGGEGGLGGMTWPPRSTTRLLVMSVVRPHTSVGQIVSVLPCNTNRA